MVYPSYFATMGLPILAGRDLDERAIWTAAPPVGVVNEAFVRELDERREPARPPVPDDRDGRGRARSSASSATRATRACAARRRRSSISRFSRPNTGRGQMALHVRASTATPGGGRPDPGGGAADRRAHAALRDVHARRADGQRCWCASGWSRRYRASSALLALLLACDRASTGCMAFAVVQRRARDRRAHGARRGSAAVLGLVMRDALGLVAAGLAIGVPVR